MTGSRLYPDISHPIDFVAACKGAVATDRLTELLADLDIAIVRAAEADPILEPALEDFRAGLIDLTSDLTATLDERDAALAAWEADEARVTWSPEMAATGRASRLLDEK